MAEISLNFKSGCLGKEVCVKILLPNSVKKGTKLPVMYLLHGLSDNHNSWSCYSSIGEFVKGKDVIVVMPDGERSFYTDIPDFGNFFTYITKELPDYIESVFPARDDREGRFIAGLSMGGYGALKSAFTYPERYKAAAAFSAVADVFDFCENFPYIKNSVFKDNTYPEKQDLFLLSKSAETAPEKPRIYHWCGTEDFMYHRNVAFSEHMKAMDFDYTYCETPGDHSWKYWNEQIKIALEFFRI